MSSLYYNPEEFGLTILDTFQWADGYDYDMTLIVRNEAGEIMYANDSGCSCDSPFEDIGRDDLVVVAPVELQAYLEERNSNSSNYAGDQTGEIVELMSRIVNA